jgi:hypothetical protein
VALYWLRGFVKIPDGSSIDLNAQDESRLWRSRKNDFASGALYAAYSGKTRRPEMWRKRRFESLAAAKQYADSRIKSLEPGHYVILEVEELKGPRSEYGTIKYRKERDENGQILPSAALV